MSLRIDWRVPALALAVVAAIGATLAVAQDQPVGPKPVSAIDAPGQPEQPVGPAGLGGGPSAVAPAKPQKTKVFRLKTCDPEDVRAILEGLLDDGSEGNPMNVPGAAGVFGPGGGGPLGGGAGGVSLPGGVPTGFGGPGALGGGFGALGGGFGGGPAPTWRMSLHPATRSLIVRGTERDLLIAADLVTLLETPEAQPLPKVKSLAAFRLKHANVEELQGVIQELEIQTRVVAAPLAKLLLASGSEQALSELAELIKELDVEVKKDDKPPETKKLLPKGDG